MKTTCLLRLAAQALRVTCEEELGRRLDPLLPYNAPKWMAKLRNLPNSLIELAAKPTPIQSWNLSEVPPDFKLDIKRDDLTGHLLSGNKIRKLEFILADAIKKNSTCVITVGGIQSNHCRATAIAAKQFGLGCHLLVRSHDQEKDSRTLSANMLLCRMHGAESYTIPYEQNGTLEARLYKLANQLKKKGERPYVISLGGSDYLGIFGIINSFNELMEQGVLSNYDDIVVASSSGGTLAGLAVANYLTGEKLRIHGVCVSNRHDYFYHHVENTLQAFGLRSSACELCDVIDNYKGECYAKRTEKDLDDIVKVCQESGILLDYSYTLKAVNGMLAETKKNPKRFKGNRILYIHTGGTFSIFDGLIDNAVHRQPDSVHVWKNVEDDPLQR